MAKVSIIGDGGWGTAIAILLFNKGIDTLFWSVSPEYAEYLNRQRENIKFLKGFKLPEKLNITSDDNEVMRSECAFFVVPCKYLRSVAERFSSAKFRYVISATKGIEIGTLLRPSEVLKEFFPESRISVLSGPSISTEVVKMFPTAVVVASGDDSTRYVRDLIMTDKFRVYTITDVIGVELGGALMNIIAIAAGISDGLGYGTNTKAAILTRGLAEITRLGMKMGAELSTFSGLSGLGDLTTTCISPQSRNRWFGEQIGKGKSINEVMGETEMVVEGLSTSKSAYNLSRKFNVDMPITEKIYEILYKGKDPASAVQELMRRDPKKEFWS
jgi:glycerol-3-phosphate dehydrogenase (NAD(P)+)